MPPLTYLDFLAVFVLFPTSLLTVASVVDRRPDRQSRTVQVGGLAVVLVLALGYTIPWDNHLIAVGVWSYGEGTVAARIWLAPLGEYLFIALQSLLVGLWTFRFEGPVEMGVALDRSDRLLGVGGGVAVGAVGLALLGGPRSTYYIGAILAWAGPVLALQWGVGWRYLVTVRRRVAALVAVPVVYLSTIDRIAIEMGIWTLSPTYTTGLTVAGLPVEEGAFFLVTSLFIVQALVLLRWVMVEWR